MHNTVRILILSVCLGLAVSSLAQGNKTTAVENKATIQKEKEEAGEKEITKKDLPAPVLAAFQKAYPKATIKGASMEIEGGKTFYEIESQDGKVKRDLLYLADGTLTEIEESVALADLPPSVKAAVSTKHPEGKIEKMEKVTRDAVVGYEVVVLSGKTTFEMSIDPRGKVLKESKTTGKVEEGEGKEGKD